MVQRFQEQVYHMDEELTVYQSYCSMWYTCSWNLCTMPLSQLHLRLDPAFVGHT